MTSPQVNLLTSPSLPSRERGLKYNTLLLKCLLVKVAPFAGAWIEILAIGL